jgi:hypothetical protein
MGCLLRKTDVPRHVTDLWPSFGASQSNTELGPACQLFHIICEFAQLRSAVYKAEVTGPVEITSAGMVVHNDLSSWARELPLTWTYLTIVLKTEDGVYGNYYHLYQSSWQATVWNNYRICCFLVHSILLQALDKIEASVSSMPPALQSAFQLQQIKSRSALSTIPSEIRASIPYQLGLNEGCRGESNSIPKPSGVFSLLGLLQVFISSTGATHAQYRWLLETPLYVGHNLGIRQALVMAQSLG